MPKCEMFIQGRGQEFSIGEKCSNCANFRYNEEGQPHLPEFFCARTMLSIAPKCHLFRYEPGLEREEESCGSCDHFRSWNESLPAWVPDFYCALSGKSIDW